MIKILIFIVILFQYVSSNWTIYDRIDFGLRGHISRFYLDNNDNCWFTDTGSHGIYKFDGTTLVYYDTSNTSLSFMDISCITQGPNGDMYFGTFNKKVTPQNMVLVIRFNGEKWEHFDLFNSTISPSIIWDILVTGENEFWVATEGGLIHYKNGTKNSYFENEDILEMRGIRSLSINKNNILYITNMNGELFSSNLNNQNIIFNKVEFQASFGEWLYCSVDSLNNLWVGSVFKREENNWVTYDEMNMERPIVTRDKKIYGQGDILSDAYEYKENSYWEKIFETPKEQALSLNVLKARDSKGNFWFTIFGSKHALAKYTPEKASVAQKTNITLYPNPSEASITVTTEQAITSLALYSLTLSKIKDLTPNHTTTQEINISTLPAGVYFIKVNDEFVKFVRE